MIARSLPESFMPGNQRQRPGQKYLALLRVSMVESLTYRTNNLVWVLIGTLPALFAIIAWLAVYGARNQVGSFTRSDIITYYLVVWLAWYVIGGRINYQISRAIKDGTLAQHLLKPYAALSVYIIGEQTWKVVSFMLAFPFYVALVWAFRHDIHLVLTPLQALISVLATLIAALLFIALEVSVGLLGFWLTNTQNVFELYDMVLLVAAGELVPLSLFPTWLFTVLSALPFRYTFSFPIEIFLGKIHGSQIVIGFIWQCGWLIILTLGTRWMWRRGLRGYSAAGM